MCVNFVLIILVSNVINVYYRQKGVLCSGCNLWIHQKCASLTNIEYNKIQKEINDPWFYRNCKAKMFPFLNLTNNQFLNFLNINMLVSNNQVDKNKNPKNSLPCSVCYKKNNKNNGLKCNTCKSKIHKKCTSLKTRDILYIKTSKNKTWECLSCQAIKFPFSALYDHEMQKESFNSNFSCKCQKNVASHIKSDFKFRFYSNELNDKCRQNLIDFNDEQLQKIALEPNFKYYQNHEFHKLINKLHKKFSILHVNICSINANSENLELLINNLDHNFDVLALSETWTPKDKQNLGKLNHITGYQKFYGTEGHTLKSGCGFYVKKGLKFTPRKDLDISFADDKNEYQSCWIEILLENQPNILIGTHYRHPKKHSDHKFNEDLKSTLHKIKKGNKYIVICGDFNYDLLKHEYNDHINEFLNTITSTFLQPCITEPTRIIQGNRPSLVDNIFTNIFNKELYSGNILDKITDHLPNFLIIKNIKNYYKIKNIKLRDMINFNHDKYLSDLQELDDINWLQFEDINEAFNAYQNKFLEIINNNAPYITLSNKASKQRQKPWVTSGIIKSIKYKNKLFGKFIKSKEKFWYERYKNHLHMISKLISKSKKNYFRKFFQENHTKSKVIWTKINEIIQNKKRENEDIFLNTDGKIITDNNKVANEFNNYYISVAQNLLKNLGKTNNKFQDYLKNIVCF